MYSIGNCKCVYCCHTLTTSYFNHSIFFSKKAQDSLDFIWMWIIHVAANYYEFDPSSYLTKLCRCLTLVGVWWSCFAQVAFCPALPTTYVVFMVSNTQGCNLQVAHTERIYWPQTCNPFQAQCQLESKNLSHFRWSIALPHIWLGENPCCSQFLHKSTG